MKHNSTLHYFEVHYSTLHCSIKQLSEEGSQTWIGWTGANLWVEQLDGYIHTGLHYNNEMLLKLVKPGT